MKKFNLLNHRLVVHAGTRVQYISETFDAETRAEIDQIHRDLQAIQANGGKPIYKTCPDTGEIQEIHDCSAGIQVVIRNTRTS